MTQFLVHYILSGILSGTVCCSDLVLMTPTGLVRLHDPLSHGSKLIQCPFQEGTRASCLSGNFSGSRAWERGETSALMHYAHFWEGERYRETGREVGGKEV